MIVPGGPAPARPRSLAGFDPPSPGPPRLPAGERGALGAAGRVPEHYYETYTEMQDRVLDASHTDSVQYIARGPYYEEIADTLVEKNLGRHTRVGTSNDYYEWILSFRDLGPPLLTLAWVNGSSLGITPVTLDKPLYPRFHTITLPRFFSVAYSLRTML